MKRLFPLVLCLWLSYAHAEDKTVSSDTTKQKPVQKTESKDSEKTIQIPADNILELLRLIKQEAIMRRRNVA